MLPELARYLGLGTEAAAWFGLQLMLMIAGALLAGRSPARRLVSVPFMLACLLLPLVAPLQALPRALLACMGLLAMLKLLQLDFETRWDGHHPVWHALSPFDVSTTRRVPPALDVRASALIVLHAVLLAGVIRGLLNLPEQASALREAWRLLLGAALVYSAMEAATESLRLGHALVGIDVPPIQHAPILSRGVGEFWGRRWNRPVSAWLGEYAFQPMVRRRRRVLALLLAFAASAALHAWMYFVAMGARAALSVTAFFLLQAPIVMLETKLRVAHWPAPLARLWTLSLLLVSSPLFVAPLLDGFGF